MRGLFDSIVSRTTNIDTFGMTTSGKPGGQPNKQRTVIVGGGHNRKEGKVLCVF